MRKLIRRIKRIEWVAFTLAIFERFGDDNGPLIAAGLAFFLILGIVPLLLVGVAALGYYFTLLHQSGDPVQIVQNLLSTQVLPAAASSEIEHLMARAHVAVTVHRVMDTRRPAGLIGFAGVIWASMQVFLNGAAAMNAAWEVREKRNWLKLRLLALGLLIASGVLLIVSIAAIAYGSWLSHHVVGSGFAINLLTQIGALVVATVMYGGVYHFLPSAEVSWRVSFTGGFFAALAWEIGTKGLSVYLLHPNVSLYGSLANLIILMVWIYYSMVILLLGAEATALFDERVTNRRGARKRSRVAADGTRLPSVATHDV